MAVKTERKNLLQPKRGGRPKGQSDEQEALVRRILDDFNRADKFRDDKVTEVWEECYKLYKSHTEEPQKGPNGEPLNRSNLFIPYTFGIIESEVPKITSSVFAQSPYIAVLPRTQEDLEASETAEALLNYQLDQLDIQDIVESWVKECFLYGTAVLKVTWKQETRLVKSVQQVPLSAISASLGLLFPTVTIPMSIEEEVVEWDDPWVEHIDLWDFYVDPDATDIDDARWVIHRVWRTVDELRELEAKGIYKKIDEVVRALEHDDESGKSEREAATNDTVDEARPDHDGLVELYEYWTDDRVTVVAAERVIIRDEENPFIHGKKPFVVIKDHVVPHEFYGIGEIEPIRYLQHELNTTRNQRIDNASMSINRMLWYDKNSQELDLNELYCEAGHVIPGVYGRDWGFADAPAVNAAGYQEEAVIKEDMQSVLQIFETSRGALPDRQETATSVVSTQSKSDERFNNKIRRIEYMGLRRLAKLMLALDQQFVDSTRTVRITGDEGPEFFEVTPQSIVGEFDFVPRGSNAEPLANKAARRQQLIGFLQVVAGIEPMAMRTDWNKMYHILADEFDLRDKSFILPPPAPGQAPLLLGPDGQPIVTQVGVPPTEGTAANAAPPLLIPGGGGQ